MALIPQRRWIALPPVWSPHTAWTDAPLGWATRLSVYELSSHSTPSCIACQAEGRTSRCMVYTGLVFSIVLWETVAYNGDYVVVLKKKKCYKMVFAMLTFEYQ